MDYTQVLAHLTNIGEHCIAIGSGHVLDMGSPKFTSVLRQQEGYTMCIETVLFRYGKGEAIHNEYQEIHFYIVRKAERENWTDVKAAIDECKVIALDVCAAIRHFSRSSQYINAGHSDAIKFEHVDLAQVQIEETVFMHDNRIGVWVQITPWCQVSLAYSAGKFDYSL